MRVVIRHKQFKRAQELIIINSMIRNIPDTLLTKMHVTNTTKMLSTSELNRNKQKTIYDFYQWKIVVELKCVLHNSMLCKIIQNRSRINKLLLTM
jgi:hypothetical protein